MSEKLIFYHHFSIVTLHILSCTLNRLLNISPWIDVIIFYNVLHDNVYKLGVGEKLMTREARCKRSRKRLNAIMMEN
jgi:hypothetical protein